MTDPPGSRPPGTEPIPAAAETPTEPLPSDAVPTEPLDPAEATATARLDYDSPTVDLSPRSTEARPPSAFAQARWAGANGRARAPSAPRPKGIPPGALPPGDPGDKTGTSPPPPPRTAPAAVPVPPGSASGTGAPSQAIRPPPAPTRPPPAPTRPPMARTVAPSPRRRRPRRRPRFGTILWGVLLLGFATFMVAWTVLPSPPDPTIWLLGGVILVGLLLVVAGIAAASRRAG